MRRMNEFGRMSIDQMAMEVMEVSGRLGRRVDGDDVPGNDRTKPRDQMYKQQRSVQRSPMASVLQTLILYHSSPRNIVYRSRLLVYYYLQFGFYSWLYSDLIPILFREYEHDLTTRSTRLRSLLIPGPRIYA